MAEDKKEEVTPPEKPSLVKGLISGVIGAVILGGAALGVVMVAPANEQICAASDSAHHEEKEKTCLLYTSPSPRDS